VPTTPHYAFPYPALSDAPNGPQQLGDLAFAIDSEIATQVLALNNTIATLANPPRAQMRQIVAQGIPNTTWTSLSFTAEDMDSHNGHDNAINNSRYTSTVGGVYLLNGGVWFDQNATGVRIIRWARNGAVLVGSGVEVPAISGGQVGIAAKGYLVTLNPTDFVELQCWHNRGASLNTYIGSGGDEAQSSMAVTLIRNNNF